MSRLQSIDFAAHAASMGATSVKVSSIAELEKALGKTQPKSRDLMWLSSIQIPYPSTEYGGTWWEVAVPEVSIRP